MTREIKTAWTSDDIESKAKDMGVYINDIDQVVDYLEDNFDANIGINWGVIEDAIIHINKIHINK